MALYQSNLLNHLDDISSLKNQVIGSFMEDASQAGEDYEAQRLVEFDLRGVAEGYQLAAESALRLEEDYHQTIVAPALH